MVVSTKVELIQYQLWASEYKKYHLMYRFQNSLRKYNFSDASEWCSSKKYSCWNDTISAE